MRTPWISAYVSVSRFVPCGQMTLTSQPAARNARLSCQTRRSNGTERFSTRISACLPLPAKALVPLGGPARLGVGEADKVDDGPVAGLGQRRDDDRLGRADHAHLGVLEHLVHVVGEQVAQVRQPALDV